MTWTACLSSAWTVTWSPSFGTTSWMETRWILTLTTCCPTKASRTVSRRQHTAGCQAESEQASEQATLKSTSDCLTAGTERSSPKMSFTLPFRFLDLKKNKTKQNTQNAFLFSFRQTWQRGHFSCTGCLPSVRRLCAALDKDCAIGNFITMKCQTHYTI